MSLAHNLVRHWRSSRLVWRIAIRSFSSSSERLDEPNRALQVLISSLILWIVFGMIVLNRAICPSKRRICCSQLIMELSLSLMQSRTGVLMGIIIAIRWVFCFLLSYVCVCVFVYLSPCCVCVFESQRSFVIFMRLVLRNLVWRPFPYGRYEYRTLKVSRDILPGLILRESLRHLSFLTSESSTTVT